MVGRGVAGLVDRGRTPNAGSDQELATPFRAARIVTRQGVRVGRPQNSQTTLLGLALGPPTAAAWPQRPLFLFQ
jgi:hypothetical protein